METSESSFHLWSPPHLDLSLDSFSDDILNQFEKKRHSIDINENGGSEIYRRDSNTTVDSVSNNSEEATPRLQEDQNNSCSCDSPIRFSSTIERATSPSLINDDETSSTTNVFQKSSTFLKSKLSICSNLRSSIEITSDSKLSSITTGTDKLTRQYPPKPLEYSTVIEPPSESLDSIPNASLASSKSNENIESDEEEEAIKALTPISVTSEYVNAEVNIGNNSDKVSPAAKESSLDDSHDGNIRTDNDILTHKMDNEDIIAESSSESIKPSGHSEKSKRPVSVPTTPKRRSFFFFRFC